MNSVSWNCQYARKSQKVKKYNEGYINYLNGKVSLYTNSKEFLDSSFIDKSTILIEGIELETDSYVITIENLRNQNSTENSNTSNIKNTLNNISRSVKSSTKSLTTTTTSTSSLVNESLSNTAAIKRVKKKGFSVPSKSSSTNNISSNNNNNNNNSNIYSNNSKSNTKLRNTFYGNINNDNYDINVNDKTSLTSNNIDNNNQNNNIIEDEDDYVQPTISSKKNIFSKSIKQPPLQQQQQQQIERDELFQNPNSPPPSPPKQQSKSFSLFSNYEVVEDEEDEEDDFYSFKTNNNNYDSITQSLGQKEEEKEDINSLFDMYDSFDNGSNNNSSSYNKIRNNNKQTITGNSTKINQNNNNDFKSEDEFDDFLEDLDNKDSKINNSSNIGINNSRINNFTLKDKALNNNSSNTSATPIEQKILVFNSNNNNKTQINYSDYDFEDEFDQQSISVVNKKSNISPQKLNEQQKPSPPPPLPPQNNHDEDNSNNNNINNSISNSNQPIIKPPTLPIRKFNDSILPEKRKSELISNNSSNIKKLNMGNLILSKFSSISVPLETSTFHSSTKSTKSTTTKTITKLSNNNFKKSNIELKNEYIKFIDCNTLSKLLKESDQLFYRDLVISDSFNSIESYQKTFIEAINEDINVELRKVAKNYFTTCIKLINGSLKSSGNNSNNPKCKKGHPFIRFVSKNQNGNSFGKEFFKCDKDNCKEFYSVEMYYKQLGIPNPYKTSIDESLPIISDNRDLLLKKELLTKETEFQFLKNHIEIYLVDCFLIQNDIILNNNSSNNSFGNQQQQQKESHYLLTFNKKKNVTYEKDDIWLISTSTDFSKSNCFLVKSLYYGQSRSGLIRVELLEGSQFPKLPSKKVQVFAIHLTEFSNELGIIQVLKNSSLLESLPIMSLILNPTKYQISNETFDLFTLNLTCQDGLDIANEFINNYHLNKYQKKVLLKCLTWFKFKDKFQISIEEERNNSCILVHGVFGSGKSRTLVVIILFILYLCEKGNNDNIKVLISSLTNIAVDRILLSLLEHGFTEFCRVGSVKKIAKPILLYTVHSSSSSSSSGSSGNNNNEEMEELIQLNQMLLDETLNQSEKRIIQKTIESLKTPNNRKNINNCKVVGATCLSSQFSVLDKIQFPIVILDECSQIPEPLSMLPIIKSQCHKMLIVGDPLQLEPNIKSKSSERVQQSELGGYEKTIFVRLSNLSIIPDVLRTQYRCHPKISKLSNQLFYDNQLKDGISEIERPPLIDQLSPLIYYDTDGYGIEKFDCGSFSNQLEANFVVSMIDILISKFSINPDRIGVICLYKAQSLKINQILFKKYNTSNNNQMDLDNSFRDNDEQEEENYQDYEENEFNSSQDSNDEIQDYKLGNKNLIKKKSKSQKLSPLIQVSTVDAFQGAEKDIIIFCCTRTSKKVTSDFIDNPQRLNVAITRAKHHFIVIGNSIMLKNLSFWEKILSSCQSRNINNILLQNKF